MGGTSCPPQCMLAIMVVDHIAHHVVDMMGIITGWSVNSAGMMVRILSMMLVFGTEGGGFNTSAILLLLSWARHNFPITVYALMLMQHE